eukprot:1712120-Amphidinium_carterae.1
MVLLLSSLSTFIIVVQHSLFAAFATPLAISSVLSSLNEVSPGVPNVTEHYELGPICETTSLAPVE